jgi:hypothetical protein
VSKPADVGPQDDWHLDQATGIAATQIGTSDFSEVSGRLIDAAAKIGESVHDTALMVTEGRLRFTRPGGATNATSEYEHQLALDFDGTTFAAHCVCGWCSARFTSAGLAGSVYDVHVEAQRH